ncbi:AlbA family DNA-binding domain-containing protein [Streptomyces misionensis]|uniref:AlbA family DNA-binding domain-containing protein n=1 Tax=Streptomyces misionensis TaxID=67331 RepID=UPI0033FAE5C9
MRYELELSTDGKDLTLKGAEPISYALRGGIEIEPELDSIANLQAVDFLASGDRARRRMHNRDSLYLIAWGDSEYRWSVLSFEASPGGSVKVGAEVECFSGEPSESVSRLTQEITARILSSSPSVRYSSSYTDGNYWLIEADISACELTFQGIFDCIDAVARLLDLDNPRRVVDCHTALRALQGGVPELLIGLQESEWLEVKSRPYDLDVHVERIELAKDVAQFANSPDGGILVIGARTKNKGGGDVIEKVTPVKVGSKFEERYQKAIDQRIYPPVSGLAVGRAKAARGDVLFIYVPPQAAAAKPFIVEGAVACGDHFENFFMIPQRRGSNVHAISGSSIHGLLHGRLFPETRVADHEGDIN